MPWPDSLQVRGCRPGDGGSATACLEAMVHPPEVRHGLCPDLCRRALEGLAMLAGLGSGASPTAGRHARKDSARARRQAESLRKSRRSRKLHGGTKGCTLGGCRGAPARQSGRPSLAHLSCFINVRSQAQAIASTRKTMPGKSLFWRIRMRMRS